MLVTEWNELRTLDLKRLGRTMRRPVLCDLRNVYDADEAAAAGLAYVGVGQGTAQGVRAARARAGAGRRPAARRTTRKGSR